MIILDEIAAYTRKRVETAAQTIAAEELKQKANALPKGNFAFEKALRKPDIAFICECKKASPSKGLIEPNFQYLDIAKSYFAGDSLCGEYSVSAKRLHR